MCPQLRAFPLVHSCLNGRNQLPVSDTSGTKSSSFGALTFLFLDEQAWIAGPIFLPSWGSKAQDRPGSPEKGSPLAFHLLSSMLASHQEIQKILGQKILDQKPCIASHRTQELSWGLGQSEGAGPIHLLGKTKTGQGRI